MTQTSTGIKLSISSGIPATYDLSGYGALTYFEIGEVTNIPQFGAQFQTVTNQPLATGITEKRKGFVNYGDPVIDMALDGSNMGQQMMKSACDGIRKSQVHAFMLQYGNGEIRYWSGRVFSFQEAPGSANNMVGATSQIGITRAILQIPRITLDLSFAENFYSLGGEAKNFSDIITFSRVTPASYFNASGVLTTAAINEPCLAYDPSTLEPLGLHVFGAATNLLTYSEQFDNAAWTKGRATISASSKLAPDGINTMYKLAEDTTAAASHRVYQTTSSTGSTTNSIYLSAGERTKARVAVTSSIEDSYGYIDVNLITGEYTTSGPAVIGASAKKIQGGIVAVSVSAIAAVSASMFIYILDDVGAVGYDGDGTSGIYIWGAQLETGSIATPYIKTEASQVTRAADIATVDDLSGWYNQSQGSVFVDCEWAGGAEEDASGRIAVSVSDGTSVNRALIYNPSGYAGGGVVSGGVVSTQFQSSVASARAKLALSMSDRFNLSVNGEYFSEPLASPPTVDRLKIGRAYNNGSHLGGYIKTLNYYPSALTENEMKLITL